MPRSSSDRKRGNKDGNNCSESTMGSTLKFQDMHHGEEIAPVGEAKGARRLRKQAPNSTVAGRPPEPTPQTAIRPDPTASTAASRRRQSSNKIPSLPNSLQPSPNKRLPSDGSSRITMSNALKPPSSNGPELPTELVSRNLSTRPIQTSATSSTSTDTRTPSGSRDFLPSVNFDDLHSSLFSDMPDIDSFPAPGGTFKHFDFDTTPLPKSASKSKGPPTVTNINPNANGRLGLNGGSIRRGTSGGQHGFNALGVNESGNSNNHQIPIKIRRKGHLNGDVKTPRKSVGPGVLTLGSDVHASPQRPSLAQYGLGLSSDGGVPLTNGMQNSQSATFDSARYQKAKSFQATPRKSHESTTTPNGFLSQPDVFGGSHTQSPARPRTQGSSTPSNKRMSILPNSAHATGLAARTISPTDARRLKRMSMMPNAPPVPFTPPTPQPDTPSSAGMPSAPSPSLAPRKSITPSSSRTTPDPNRKSYSSGFSISSSTSYNSNPTHTAARMSQIIATSRLPAPKSRAENLQAPDDEFVPPVPKIPQAYGSPKEELSHPFPALRKASVTSNLSNSTVQNDESSAKAQQLVLQSRPHRLHPEPATERKPSGGIVKRPIEPSHLPPSTVFPLDPSIATKISNLMYHGEYHNLGTQTPPPSNKGVTYTPTTPMTTYKTTFPKPFVDGSTAEPIAIRSNSSHHFTRTEGLPFRASSSSSTMVPNRPDSHLAPAGRPAMSPFVSSSLPKSSGEYNYLRRETSNPVDTKTEPRQSKLTGPRSQRGRKSAKDDVSSNQTDSPVEKPTTPSFGSSLRRKLSLTRRKSISKSQHAGAESDAELPAKGRQSEDMPPPRLPASATWNGSFTSPSPSQRSGRSRNVSNASTVERNRSNTVDPAEAPKKQLKPAATAGFPAAKRTTRSFLEGASKQSGSTLKEFLHDIKTSEPAMDRDDMAAEEEMRRLASRRKETENAARELDALLKRASAKERVSPSAALRMAKLNIFERGEIVDYKDVYFCGTQNAKKFQGSLNDTTTNFGYDDERGDYNIVTGDHLAYRYEIVDILGKGSFGQVVRCIDHKTGALVAIKIIRNKKRFHQQALVEVDILQKLREWDPHSTHGMISFTQSFYFREHLCISTELLGMNLYEFIKCHDFRGFSLKLIRRFAKQILSSLVLLKSKRVIHCDLKPENVLLSHPSRSEVKVIDFGSSCHENEKVYTYIQSRFYRSPEVILGMTYGMPIDMWSLGCILAELLTGYPIFPGENEQEQLACIMEVFGPPERHLIEKSTRKKLFFDSLGKPRITVSSKGKRRRPSSKSLQQALKCDDEAFLDFITRSLRWDPERRLKPDEAMQHEFITGRPSKGTSTRSRITPSMAAGPSLKRFNSITQPASSRPLPQPPSESVKPSVSSKNRDAASSNAAAASPMKRTPSHRRNSTINVLPSAGAGAAAGTKRALNGAAVAGSGLPRVTSTQRSGNTVGMGGKGAGGIDLANAAAAASLAQKSR